MWLEADFPVQTLWKNVTRSEFSFQKTIADTNYVL